jgi:hypothetical protein
MAFLPELSGKAGSFVAASAGNDYHDAFLPGCRSASNPDAAISTTVFCICHNFGLPKSRRQKHLWGFIFFHRPVGFI